MCSRPASLRRRRRSRPLRRPPAQVGIVGMANYDHESLRSPRMRGRCLVRHLFALTAWCGNLVCWRAASTNDLLRRSEWPFASCAAELSCRPRLRSSPPTGEASLSARHCTRPKDRSRRLLRAHRGLSRNAGVSARAGQASVARPLAELPGLRQRDLPASPWPHAGDSAIRPNEEARSHDAQ